MLTDEQLVIIEGVANVGTDTMPSRIVRDLISDIRALQKQNLQLRSGLEQAEFDFRFIHVRYGKGDISGGEVIQYSADSGKRVNKYLQGGISDERTNQPR